MERVCAALQELVSLAGSPQLVQLIDAISKEGCYLMGDLQEDPKYCKK